MTKDTKPTTQLTKNDNSTVTIEATLPATMLEAERKQALENLGQHVKVDGFRPGKAPADVVIKEVGEMALLEEMARLTISTWYPTYLVAENIEVIGRPEIKITKLASGNPLEVTITSAIMPTVELGDVKKIAKAANKKTRDTEVSDKELEEAITQLRKFRAQAQMDEKRAKEAKEKGEPFTPTNLADITEGDLPELTEDYVKSIGNFDSVDAFKKQLRDNLEEEKKKKAVDERRMEIMEGILDSSTITLPELLIDHELDRAIAQVEYDVSMAGVKFEDYLKQIQKTKEEFRNGLRIDAEKRAKSRLIIETLARNEKIEMDKVSYEKDVQRLLEQYKDQDQVSEDSVRAYLAEIFQNQAVFAWLDAIQ